MPETIKADELPLRDVFNDKYRFVVPDYQRPYSWRTEQTEELLEDLTNAAGSIEPINSADPYFLGSIVLTKEPNQTKADVVDGQQRLTTITILFAVLRDLAEDSGLKNSLQTKVHDIGNRAEGTDPEYRLTQRERDRVFFQENIQEIGAIPEFIGGTVPKQSSRARMFENTKRLHYALQKCTEKERERLGQFLLTRCYLVVVETPSLESAYRIFSVLNSRGLALRQVDLLKADIIGGITPDLRSRYTNMWESIEEEMGQEKFQQLFNHIYMINERSRPPTSSASDYRKGIIGKDTCRSDAEKVAVRKAFMENKLPDYKSCFDFVTDESVDDAKAVATNESLEHLRRLPSGENHWIPVAMEIVRLYRDKIQSLNQLFPALERLAYTMFMQRMTREQRVARWAQILRAMEKGLKQTLEATKLSESEHKAILERLDTSIDPDRRRVLLLRLDNILAESSASYHYPRITVEHVLPQNPKNDSQWIKSFPDSEIREEWTNKIANLVLLSRSKNSRASNFDFERKKREYFEKGKSPRFEITNQVLKHQTWTPRVLERRQADIINRFKKEWQLN